MTVGQNISRQPLLKHYIGYYCAVTGFHLSQCKSTPQLIPRHQRPCLQRGMKWYSGAYQDGDVDDLFMKK